MSLLGIDVGTSGCKAVLFDTTGRPLAGAYAEYDTQHPQPGWAELDSFEVWDKVRQCIRQAAAEAGRDAVQALAVCSLGEAVVPISANGEILGPSLLNFDVRGAEFLPQLNAALEPERWYTITGNTLGNHFSLTKLMWLKRYQQELYDQTFKFMHWGGLVGTLLGAEPALDYSLADRSLLFDLNTRDWSDELLAIAGIARDKLPRTVPSGTAVGQVSPAAARELGLPAGVVIVTGAHDQCANAMGAGVIAPGQAMYGMGTYICIVPVFNELREAGAMIARGLNTEHHAVPGSLVTFLYNQGGALLKWYRDTFAPLEKKIALESGKDIYSQLISELPEYPSRVLALPHFTATGPPDFIGDSCGVLAGLRLETQRGEILKGLLEGATYYLREGVETLPGAGIPLQSYVAVGGGSKSDIWIQLSANILQRPFSRPKVTEAGALGAAILSGVGSGIFASAAEGVAQMVHSDRAWEPNPAMTERYTYRYNQYRRLYAPLRELLQELAAEATGG